MLEQLYSAHGKTMTSGNRDYRLNHGFIEIKLKENDEDRQPWKLVVPDVEEAQQKIYERNT